MRKVAWDGKLPLTEGLNACDIFLASTGGIYE